MLDTLKRLRPRSFLSMVALSVGAFLWPGSASACLNFMDGPENYDRVASGEMVKSRQRWSSLVDYVGEDDLAYLLPSPSDPELSSAARDWEGSVFVGSRRGSGVSFDHGVAESNNAAVEMIREGEVAKAVELLEKIEKESPGHYEVASNLGTAYELAGDNAKALRWIKKGIERNPNSHAGSEWVHVRILQAKLQMAKDPLWLNSNSIVGLDFGSGPLPSEPRTFPTGNEGESLDLDQVYRSLEYQLKERMSLVGPPDPVVGDLLYDYAQAGFHLTGVRWANKVMKGAEAYGVKRSTFEVRKDALLEFERANPVRREVTHWPMILVALVPLFLFGIAWLRLNQRLEKEHRLGLKWSMVDRGRWIFSSMGLLFLTIVLSAWSMVSWMSFDHRSDLWMLSAGVVVGLWFHFKGLRLAGRKWWLGAVAWPLVILLELSGSAMFMLLILAWGISVVLRVVHACRHDYLPQRSV